MSKEQEETGAQSKLDYWKEADWLVLGVRQRWSRLVNDLFNSSVCMYVKYKKREADREKRETLHLPECVCQSQSIWRCVLVWESDEGRQTKMKCNSLSTVWRCLLERQKSREKGGQRDSQSPPIGGMRVSVLSPCICVCVRERKVAGLSGSLAVQPCSLCLAYRRRNLK